MAFNIRSIVTAATTFAGSVLSWITRRSGKEALTTTLAIPGVAFALNAASDIKNSNHEQGSIGIAEAALSVGGSLCLGYMTGNGTDAAINSAAFLGTYALVRAGVVEKNATTTRNRVRV